MRIELETLVYQRIKAKLNEHFSGIYVTNERGRKPPSFPCVVLKEDDSSTYTRSLDDRHIPLQDRVLFTAYVYSNKVAGKALEARKIMSVLDSEMLAMGFVRSTLLNTSQDEATLYELTARYTAIAGVPYKGDGDEIMIYQ